MPDDMKGAVYRGMLQIDLITWMDAVSKGRDPVVLARAELREALTLMGDCYYEWTAGVIDFGGARLIPWTPGERLPFGVLFLQLHAKVVV